MKWLKYLLALILLFLSLPLWRLIDWAVLTLPYQKLFTTLLCLWAVVFIIPPFRIFFPKIHRLFSLLILVSVGVFSWLSTPFSSHTSLEPELRHCGLMSYSGFFYPIRGLLSRAHQDDLDIRNQICWLVKMIKKVPDNIPPGEHENHLKLLSNKLQRPQHKYRAALPWVMVLQGLHGADLVEASRLWQISYSEEINSREYSFLDWPHSWYIKQEYGFIENNWSNIVFEIQDGR